MIREEALSYQQQIRHLKNGTRIMAGMLYGCYMSCQK